MPNPFNLSGRVALVTGGGTGLGFAIARGLGRAGARVIVNGRRGKPLADAVAVLAGEGIDAYARSFDVTHADAVRESVAAIERDVGLIDEAA